MSTDANDLDIRDHLGRAVHGLARQPRRHDRAPRDPHGSRGVARGPRMDGQRVHAHLRRAAAHRRRARRPVRAPADVLRRARGLHARLRRRCAGSDRGRAQPREGDPGARRRDRDAAHPDAPERGGTGREAWPCARRLGWDRRARDRLRPARRRRRRRRASRGSGSSGSTSRSASSSCRSRCAASRRAMVLPGRLDLPGLVLGERGLFGIVWGLVRGNGQGWSSPEIVGSLVVGALLVAAFVGWELARQRRCSRCGSSARPRSRSPTPRPCSCSSACSARSSCSRSSSRPCRATRRSAPGCGSCRGRSRRCSSRRSRARSPTGSARSGSSAPA